MVKEIFNTYANTNLSLGNIAKIMIEKNKDKWTNLKVSRILHNPVYVKADVDIYHFFKFKKCIIINNVSEFIGENGCNLYGKRDRGKNKYRNMDEQFLVIAQNKGVVNSQTWLECQKKLDNNIQIKNSGKGKHTWLSGLLKCGYCNYSMTVKKYKNKKYLSCSGKTNYKICNAATNNNNIDEIELTILTQMKNINKNTGKDKIKIKKNGNSQELNKLKIQLENIESQLINLINSIANGNEILLKYVNNKISQLDEEKMYILNQINNKQIKKTTIKTADLENWDILDFDVQKSIAHNLIEKILVD